MWNNFLWEAPLRGAPSCPVVASLETSATRGSKGSLFEHFSPPSPLSYPYKLNESASPLLLQFRTRSSGMPPEAGANYAVRCRLARKLRLPGSGRWHAGKIQSDLPVICRPQATEKCAVLFRVQCRRRTPRLGRCALHTLTFPPHSFKRADLKSPCVP